MPELQITLFGAMQMRQAAQTFTHFSTAKVQALLAYLAVESQRAHARDTLIGLFWPDFAPESARGNLRQSLFRLRQIIPAEYLHITHQTAQFQATPDCQIDVITFTDLLAACQRHAHTDLTVCPACGTRLAHAVALYQGDFLSGLFLDDSPAFEEWLLLKREWLRRETLGALHGLTVLHERQRDYDQAHRYAWRQVELDPAREEAHQQLMRVLALSGRRSEALAQYESCRRLLAEELGVEPSRETLALYEQIRTRVLSDKVSASENHSITLSPNPPDFGELGRSITPAHNLPVPLTSFIGRQPEIAEVTALLTETRLLTLTGAGGSGKTRLALQLANALLERYPDGAWFVDLAPLADASLVTQTVAMVLQVREQPNRALLETLVETLRPKQLLLILDNCEHLVTACAQLAETLLQAAPGLQILATSREALAISSETAWRVPGLARPALRPLPPLAELAQFAAVQLFCTRATTVLPTFALTDQNAFPVTQICRRLDGLPLALELAAARIKLLSPAQIAARLDDRFRLLTANSRTASARQQTLRATLDWSYNLLTDPERMLLRRLAIFAGGFTWEAAATIVAMEQDGSTGDHLLDLLGRLVDKSLVVVDRQPGGEVRYRLLETVRQYGWERLVACGEQVPLQRCHAAFYTALAEAAEPALRSTQPTEWLQCLEAEIDNLRATLTWSLTGSGETEWGLRLAGALGHFWLRYLSEGRSWLELALARTVGWGPSAARAKALCHAGDMANNLGDLVAAKARLEEGIALWRTLDDKAGLAYALTLLPEILRDCGEYEKIPALAAECFALYAQIGDQWGMARSLQELAGSATEQREFTKAHDYCRRAFALYHALGDKQGCGLIQHIWGTTAEYQGEYATARGFFEIALAFFRELGDKILVAMELNSLGIAVRYQADATAALALFHESLTVAQSIGFTLLTPYCLASVAGIAIDQGRLAEAAQLCGAVEQLCATHGIRLQLRYRAIFLRDLATLSAQLDPTALAVALAKGQALTLEQAIAVAQTLFAHQSPCLRHQQQ